MPEPAEPYEAENMSFAKTMGRVLSDRHRTAAGRDAIRSAAERILRPRSRSPRPVEGGAAMPEEAAEEPTGHHGDILGSHNNQFPRTKKRRFV